MFSWIYIEFPLLSKLCCLHVTKDRFGADLDEIKVNREFVDSQKIVLNEGVSSWVVLSYDSCTGSGNAEWLDQFFLRLVVVVEVI